MARPLTVASNGKYDLPTVRNMMTSGGGIARGRFDVLDLGFNFVTSLQGVTAASVTFDRTRPITGMLRLSLNPTSMPGTRPAWDMGFLRQAPDKFYIKAYAQFGPMPDGGLAEFPMGVYVWQRPARHIEGTLGAPWPGAETWDADCPDLTHWFNIDGPGDPAFSLDIGTPIGQCIAQVLAQNGFDDLSGMTWSPLPLPSTMTYFFWQTFSDIFQTGDNGRNQVTGSPEDWLSILKGLHQITAFSDPWFNLDGVYQAQLSPNLDVGAPSVIYDSASPGVMILPMDSQPDPALIANRVFATSPASQGDQLTAVVDLNDWLPQHPLSQQSIGHYVSVPYSIPGAPSYEALYTAGLIELVRRLSTYEKYTMTTCGFLALHEADELVAVRVTNDPELSSTVPLSLGGVPLAPDAAALIPNDWQYHAFLELGWTYDFFGGEMKHTLGRHWRTF